MRADALTDFDPAHAPVVAGWVGSADEGHQWCGRREHPFPAEAVVDWQADPDASAHLLLIDGEPAGYGEVWRDAEEDEAELAHIIVAPAFRGQGVGRTLTTRLREKARETGLSQIIMRVDPANEKALHCYLSVAFTRLDPAEEAAWNSGQPIEYRWLRDSDERQV